MKSKEAVDITYKSPLTFKFVSQPLEPIQSKSAPDVSAVDVAAPVDIHFVEGESETVKRAQTDPSTADLDPIKTFTIWINLSESRYNHKKNIRRNPIHGRWPDVKKSDHDSVYYALKEVVPESIAQHGLCDWVTGGQLSEDVKLARTDENTSVNWQIHDRLVRRRNREKMFADEDLLTSWPSIKSVLQPRGDDFAEEFEAKFDPVNKPPFEPAEEPTEEPTDDYTDSETISEPLGMDRSQSQALASQHVSRETENSSSDRAPGVDHQPNDDDSMAKSASNEVLQKILEMPTSSKAMPALEAASKSSRSDSNDQSDKERAPLDDEK